MSELEWVCPKCGSAMRINKGGAFCADENGCGFRVWRKVAGKELTDEELNALVRGRKVLALGLKSKAGKSFNAWLVPGAEGVEFSFEGLPGKETN